VALSDNIIEFCVLQALGVECIKLFKTEQFKLTPFTASLLLSIAWSHKNSRLEDNVFDYLKDCVWSSFETTATTTATNEMDLWWLPRNYFQSILLFISHFLFNFIEIHKLLLKIKH
jgi:hypothetical protein